MNIEAEYQNKEFFEWRMPVTAKKTLWEGKEELPGPDEEHEASISLTRKRDETGSLGDWTIDTNKLEAIFTRTQARKYRLRPKHIRLLGPATYASQIDYKLWIHRGMTLKSTTGDVKAERYFGWFGALSDTYLCVETDSWSPYAPNHCIPCFWAPWQVELNKLAEPRHNAKSMQLGSILGTSKSGNIFTSPTQTLHRLRRYSSRPAWVPLRRLTNASSQHSVR